MTKRIPQQITDLVAVIYSAGKVFDGLRTGRVDTENFLRSGSLSGVSSRADLALLQDLRDAGQYVIDHAGSSVDASYVQGLNRTITRSGALHPGELRRANQRIGVDTALGRHEPPAMSEADLAELLRTSSNKRDAVSAATAVFISLARAQPFEDGNKRTALLAANGLLIERQAGVTLGVPFDEADPSVARAFNDRLARAYVVGEDSAVAEMMQTRAVRPLIPPSSPEAVYARHPELDPKNSLPQEQPPSPGLQR